MTYKVSIRYTTGATTEVLQCTRVYTEDGCLKLEARDPRFAGFPLKHVLSYRVEVEEP